MLANILRPKNLDEFIGQKDIIGKDKPLYKLIQKKDIPHLFFYGKPGSGKTTLAKIITNAIGFSYYYFNATTIKIDDIRKVFKQHENALMKPVIFIDEVHRLNKTQQEVLLPIMENYQAIIIGASTENPFYTLTSAIRSRGFLYEFKALTQEDMKDVIKSVEKYLDIKIGEDEKKYLISSSNGDARAMINLIDFSYKADENLKLETIKALRDRALNDGTSSADTHYDLASAMIKSLRGSDVDAALYYLARLIDGAEQIEFIARRLVIFASEDIGNANPNALNLATSTMTAVSKIGYPEGRIILAQCVVYLASSPKSNSSYLAINKVLQQIKNGTILEIPKNIKDNAIGYKYPHDYGGWVEQDYLLKDLDIYHSNKIAFEKTLDDWLNKIKKGN